MEGEGLLEAEVAHDAAEQSAVEAKTALAALKISSLPPIQAASVI
jgi:hypothetical protein